MIERDYAAEMDALIEAEKAKAPEPSGSVFASYASDAEHKPKPAEVALAVCMRLETQDPELLAWWLWQRRAEVLAAELTRRERSRAAKERRNKPKRAFAAAMAEFERTGDADALRRAVNQ